MQMTLEFINQFLNIIKYQSKISVGFGATDLIQVINSIKVEKLYIVNPSFAMVDVYCKSD